MYLMDAADGLWRLSHPRCRCLDIERRSPDPVYPYPRLRYIGGGEPEVVHHKECPDQPRIH